LLLWNLLYILLKVLYRFSYTDAVQIPVRGPALVVSNHGSLADGFLVGSLTRRFLRFLVYKPYFDHPVSAWMLRTLHCIPMAQGSARREIVESLQAARAELNAGHLVCIFAEGGVTRTGHFMPLQKGFTRVVSGLDVPIIPVHIDGLWGTLFSFSWQRMVWKWPRFSGDRALQIRVGAPLPASSRPIDVWLAIKDLECETWIATEKTLPEALRQVLWQPDYSKLQARRSSDGVFTELGLTGYSCAALGGIVALNTPTVEFRGDVQLGSREGSVGRLLPGVTARIREDGRLLLRGHQHRRGWYDTGIAATLDDDGFLFLA
jgi:1-acyl-sn-glycerol-3-phosphate acyltransferase